MNAPLGFVALLDAVNTIGRKVVADWQTLARPEDLILRPPSTDFDVEWGPYVVAGLEPELARRLTEYINVGRIVTGLEPDLERVVLTIAKGCMRGKLNAVRCDRAGGIEPLGRDVWENKPHWRTYFTRGAIDTDLPAVDVNGVPLQKTWEIFIEEVSLERFIAELAPAEPHHADGLDSAPPPGPKPGDPTPKERMWAVALELLETGAAGPPRHGRLTALARLVQPKFLGYTLETVERHIRDSVRDWEKENSGR